MAKKIKSLTAHLVELLAACRDEWIKIGLSCEPCDFEAAKIAATKCYEAAGLAPPKWWFVFDSPLSAAIGSALLKHASVSDSVRASVCDSVWVSVRASVSDSVSDSVWVSVRDSVSDSVSDSVRDSVRASVCDSVWASVWASVRDSVRASVSDSVRASVSDSVRASVWVSVSDSVRDSVRASVRASVSDQAYGPHDAGWLSFYAFFRDHCALKNETEKLSGLLDIAKSCGWWAPYSDACIFQHRHCELHRDADGRLHNESGMACRYRDGFGVWAIDGIRVDEQIVMRPESQTIEQMDAEENGDIRAIRIDRYGWANYLRDSASKCVDFRDNEVEGTKEALYVTPKNETRLVATCATGRVFAMGCPSQIKTCQSAQEWLAGDKKFQIVGRT